MKHVLVSGLLAMTLSPSWAASANLTLSVPTMDCPVCPITIKKALSQVPGVLKVEVSFERRQAQVLFDDARTTPAALMRATQEAGYPSQPAARSGP